MIQLIDKTRAALVARRDMRLSAITACGSSS
jgi:hypothetical protein